MARPSAGAEDYRAIVVAGDARVRAVAEELLGQEMSLVLMSKGLLSDGVLDALSDLPSEALSEVFVDALGEAGLGREAVWPVLVAAAAEPARRRRRCFARAPPEVGAHWSGSLGAHLAFPTGGPGGSSVPRASASPAFRWATRGRGKRSLVGAPMSLDAAEAAERERWAQAAAAIIVDAKLPVAELASRVLGGAGTVRAVFGGRRLRTLRLRVRGVRRIIGWVTAAGLGGFPRGEEGIRAFLAYVADLVANRAAKSTPSAALHALKFFEVRGGVDEGLQVAGHPLVVGAVAEAEAALSGGPRRLVRKAPQYPIVVVEALERHVVNPDVLPYVRVFAWFRLVLVWTACRSDDLARVSPADVRLEDGTLELRLRRTKTTGPGKRIEVVCAWVGPDAWLTCDGWLVEGFRLFQAMSVDDERDYLVPLPTADLSGCRRAAADYPRMLEMGRALLIALRGVGGGLLLRPVSALMWSEHSGRAVLPTWGAALGEPSDVLDRFGRWSDGKSSGYVRANRAIILSAQGRIAFQVRAYVDPVLARSERDLIESVRSFLRARLLEPSDVEDQVIALVPTGRAAPAAAHPLGPVPVASTSAGSALRPPSPSGASCRSLPPGSVGGSPSVRAAPSPGEASGSEGDSDPALPTGSLVVAVTLRTRRRTLHRVPGCGRRPGVSFRDFVVLAGAPQAGDYTHTCRQCWPPAGPSARPPSCARTSSPSGTSSTSRSSESSTSSDDSAA